VALHEMPQLVPLQVAVPFDGGTGQGEQELPQLLTLELETQVPLQLWKPIPQLRAQLPAEQL
jgi:hypothetical protein